MFAVLKREFRSYFQNVIGWLFVAALMALFGLYFYVYNLRQGYPYLYYTLSAITIIFMIAVPILTMRSFAEDRKNKTDQLMLTAPVPVAKIVLGKYLAMLAVFTVDIAVFCVTPLILRAFGTIPMGESYIAILAFWLYGAASIAVGMFISAFDGKPGDIQQFLKFCGTVIIFAAQDKIKLWDAAQASDNGACRLPNVYLPYRQILSSKPKKRYNYEYQIYI